MPALPLVIFVNVTPKHRNMYRPAALSLSSAQLICVGIWVEDVSLPCQTGSFVLEHLVVHSHVLALDRQGRFGCLSLDDKVVVASGAVFVRVLPLLGVLAENLFALFAGEDQLRLLQERMFLLLRVAFCAVKPFSAFVVALALVDTGIAESCSGGCVAGRVKSMINVQHGARIATWALRMCLLALVSGGHDGVVPRYIPHGGQISELVSSNLLRLHA